MKGTLNEQRLIAFLWAVLLIASGAGFALIWEKALDRRTEAKLDEYHAYLVDCDRWFKEASNDLISFNKRLDGAGLFEFGHEDQHMSAHGEPRSACWRKTREAWIEEHSECEACGRQYDLNVHHVVPFHVDKSRECDPENLITLCRGCHELIGHLRHFDSHNPDVRADAASWRKKIEERPRATR